MGMKWDGSVPDVEVFAEMHRVLKDGGRLLCFAGSRTFHRMWCNIEDGGFTIEDTIAWMYGSGFPKHKSKLKPAFEPICVARKGGVSELNIDNCRIPTADAITPRIGIKSSGGLLNGTGELRPPFEQNALGRWPANVVLDEEAAAMLDEQSGERQLGARPAFRSGRGFSGGSGTHDGERLEMGGGGASRFFYCAKADRTEREHGLEGATCYDTEYHEGGGKAKRSALNHHPTVKPVDLMRWLVRLVTVEGQTVLDPFTGSGTTGVACILEGRQFIGCELQPEYADIARQRIGNTQPNLFGAA
jgi:site-specific DNA-methyltransferase (adenine-specific)